MTQETIDVQTPRGTMPVYIHRPGDRDRAGEAPLVVMLMDAPGIRPALHGYAEQLAQAGYTAALPDLFYMIDPAERPRPERLAARDPEEFKRMGQVVASMRDEFVHDDVVSMLAALLGDGEGAAPRSNTAWGCVGWCMGGRYALRAAEDFGEPVAATALLHPSRIVTDAADSPHLAVDRVHGALYFGWGERDHVSPPELIEPLRERLEAAGIDHQIEVLPGAEHGFTMPGMPAYDEAAASRAWAGALAVLREHLPAGER